MSSAMCPSLGSSSLSSIPLLPCLANLNMAGVTGRDFCFEVIVVILCLPRIDSGSSLPRSFSICGFGSKRSICEDPPDWKSEMTRLAFPGGIACFREDCPRASPESREPRAAGPKMPAVLPRNARLFNVLSAVIRWFHSFMLLIPFMDMGRKPQAKKQSYDKSQSASCFPKNRPAK